MFLPLCQKPSALGQALGMAVIYYGLAEMGSYLASMNGNASPVWPGAGVALAAVLHLGYHLVPGVVLGSWIAELTGHSFSMLNTLTRGEIAIGNGLGIFSATYLIQRWTGRTDPFQRLPHVASFILAALLSSIPDACLGVTALSLFGGVPWSAYGLIWWTWWTATVVGFLVFTPVVLAWVKHRQGFGQLLRQRSVEAVLLLFCAIATSRIAFGEGYPVEYLLIPILVWAVFNFKQVGATSLVALFSMIAIAGTLQGFGSFVRNSQLESLLLLQSFVGVIALTTLVLLAAIQENEAAKSHLQRINADLQQTKDQLAATNEKLEEKVYERTLQLAGANAEILDLNQKLTTENLRLSAEVDIARKIQRMILPKPEELAAIEGLNIAGFMEPADEVGGDYYDVLYTDGIVTIGIGDVTGHGLESGLLMLMTQTAVRTLKEIREHDTVRFLNTLNRTIYKNLQRMNSDKNLTLAVLNYANGTLSLSGQHEEAILVRQPGKIERIDTIDLGFPIGLDDDIADFISHRMLDLHPGDGVVLYTDGITEAENLRHQQYGIERFCEIISQHWCKSAQEIKDAVIADLRRHIGGQKVFDDITLLVLKRQDESRLAPPPQAVALER